MLKVRKLFKFTLIILIIILNINACGVKTIFKNYNTSEDVLIAETTAARAMLSNKMVSMDSFDYEVDEVSFGTYSTEGSSENQISDTNNNEKKLIKNYSIDVESTNFDIDINDLNNEITKYQGVIDNSSVNNNINVNRNTKRYASFSIRIPYDKVSNFVTFLTNKFNVLYKNEYVEDVTDSYYDVMTRINNLKQEEEKLKELSAKAENVDEMIKVEDRMANVRYEIESLYNRIKNYDKKINYSTVNLSITEVVIVTDINNNKPSKDKIIEAFNENLESTKRFVINVAIYSFTHIPAFCLVAIVVLLFLLVVFIINKIKNLKNNNVEVEEVVNVENEVSEQENNEVRTKRKYTKRKTKEEINLPTTENQNKEIEVEARKINDIKITGLLDNVDTSKEVKENDQQPEPVTSPTKTDEEISLESKGESIKTKMLKDLENKYKEHYVKEE